MKTLTAQQTTEVASLQSTLLKIEMKQPVFFNITQFIKLGLVKRFGLTERKTTNWILTDKAKQLLNVAI